MAQARLTVSQEERSLAMSYEAWRGWAGESTQAEWANGEGITFVPPTVLHAQLSRFLFFLTGLFVEARDLGEMFSAPIEMRLARSAREPDLLFLAHHHRHRLKETRLLGPADLVIEIVSPESSRRDRVEKLAEYEEAGVPEYWLFDPRPRRRTADFFHLRDGRYGGAPLDADGRHHSTVLPGFWLRPAWLWDDPLPNVLACLAEIAPDLFGRHFHERF